jgi:hypothetical protein
MRVGAGKPRLLHTETMSSHWHLISIALLSFCGTFIIWRLDPSRVRVLSGLAPLGKKGVWGTHELSDDRVRREKSVIL